MKHVHEYRDAALCRNLIKQLNHGDPPDIRLMEVCGTHTMAIFRQGIRSVIPGSMQLLSGPGCPVCVTAQGEIDAFIATAREKDIIVATFGDLIRVPGTDSSLQQEQARGKDIRIVYSPADAVEIARKHPDKQVVFLGVGFETTAPAVAASVISARQKRIENYSVHTAHKCVPPALNALMETEGIRIDGFILPGHVSVIIGTDAYLPFFEKFRIPSVVAGFEPMDILQAIHRLARMIKEKAPGLENAYPRAVTSEGNPRARQIMDEVFETGDATWRGLGMIPDSGLLFRSDYSAFNASERFNLPLTDVPPPAGCACGRILTGRITPPECPLFRKTCTPADPVGPCMVSSEGTCAAYYRYQTPGAQ